MFIFVRIISRFLTMLGLARHIGTDRFGHKYYENRRGKRWVCLYHALDSIEETWHGWLHYNNSHSAAKSPIHSHHNRPETPPAYKAWRP